jgi:hypothetical protein
VVSEWVIRVALGTHTSAVDALRWSRALVISELGLHCNPRSIDPVGGQGCVLENVNVEPTSLSLQFPFLPH